MTTSQPPNKQSETPMNDNFCSSKHPHEPEIKPQLDTEGRCLICGLLCNIDSLNAQLTQAQNERDYDKLLIKCLETTQEYLEKENTQLSTSLKEVVEDSNNYLQAKLNEEIAYFDWKEIQSSVTLCVHYEAKLKSHDTLLRLKESLTKAQAILKGIK